jgi:hypothetical protein
LSRGLRSRDAGRFSDTARASRDCAPARAPSGRRSRAASPCRRATPRVSRSRTRNSAPRQWHRPGKTPAAGHSPSRRFLKVRAISPAVPLQAHPLLFLGCAESLSQPWSSALARARKPRNGGNYKQTGARFRSQYDCNVHRHPCYPPLRRGVEDNYPLARSSAARRMPPDICVPAMVSLIARVMALLPNCSR